MHDDLAFDNFMIREINKLLYNIINPNEYNEKEKKIQKKLKDIVYLILNDSLIECYMKTFDKIECPYIEKYDSKHINTENLVKLCLIATYDRIS